MRTSLLTRVYAIVLLAIVASPALSLNPDKSLSQYGHNAWRVQDGTFAGAPTSLTQTQDGYLWIGTRAGLYRFDGARFVSFEPHADEPVRSARVMSLLGDRDGSLWIGTGADLEHWHDGDLTHYPSDKGYLGGFFLQIHQARDGSVWVNRARISDGKGPFCRVAGVELQCYGKDNGINLRGATSSIVEDADGSFWTHSDVEIVHWSPTTLQALPGGVTLNGAVDSIQYVAFDAGRNLVVGMVQPTGGGLSLLKNGVIEPYVVGSLDGHQVDAQQLFLDSRRALWIGTQGHGLYRVTGTRVEHYSSNDGLSGDTVNGFYEDREGNIWVATSQGVDKFRNLRVSTYSAREGLSGDLVSAVLAAHDGSVWVNNFHSLDHVHDGVVTSLQAGHGLPGGAVTSLFEDHDHRLWVGIDDGLVVAENGHFKNITRAGDPHIGGVTAITQDTEGSVWVIANEPSPHGSVLRISNDLVQEQIGFDKLPFAMAAAIAADPVTGVWLPMVNGDVAHWHDGHADVLPLNRAPHTGNVSGIVAAPDGSVYISSPLGLLGWRAGKIQSLSSENGLPCQHVLNVVAGKDALWMYGDCALLSVANDELTRWWQQPTARLNFFRYDALDGAQPAAAGYFPKASRSPDGKIWLANSSVVQMIDPTESTRNELPPPVRIERIVADRVILLPNRGMQLPALTRDLQIDYTALSFSVPEKVRFQYQLEGHDDTWVDAQTRRQAFYTDLPPGRYRFRVKACNNDGVWNESGAELNFEIAPTFYQTRLFRFATVMMGIVILWLLYWMRLRQVARRMRLNLRTKLIERERIARELHDTLLQGMQGMIFKISAIAERLPPKESGRGEIEAALNGAEAMLEEGRDRLTGLRRGSELDSSLLDALATAATDLAGDSAIEIRVERHGDAIDINANVQEELYRIAVEALTNSIRHAAATRIEIDLRYEVAVFTVQVRDNGVGFHAAALQSEAKPGHFGLLGMHERAHSIGAQLEIWSRDGAGTEVSCRIDAKYAYRTANGRRFTTWAIRLWNPSEDNI